jgi:hypothetical protein
VWRHPFHSEDAKKVHLAAKILVRIHSGQEGPVIPNLVMKHVHGRIPVGDHPPLNDTQHIRERTTMIVHDPRMLDHG